MMGLFKKHPVAVILSVIFHLALIGFFVFGVNLSEEKIQTKPAVNVVKATAIDESKIKAEANKLKELERQKKLKEQKRLDDLKKKRLAEEKKLAELKKKQADDKKKLAQKKAAEAAKQAKIKKQKALEAKKRAEDAKKQKLADAKKLKERLAKEKAKKIAVEKAQAAKAAKEKAAKEQAKREQALQALAAQEEQDNRDNATTDKFVGLIIQKVERNWIQPPGDISGLSCVVRVRLIPGGDVVDAQVIQSSGNAFFDRSVELATRKAAPLPLPSDPNLFGRFRTLEFYFRPGG